MSELIEKLPESAREKLEKKAQPAWVSPMLASLTHERFSREGWLFEPKFDGERCLAFKQGKEVKMFSRNRKAINGFYPELAEALERHEHNLIVDGEVVAFEGAITSFAKLQRRIQTRNPAEARRTGVNVYYYLFDMLYLDGYDLRQMELRLRKKLLGEAVDFQDPLRFTTHRNTQGESYYREACKKGWEGLIAKRADGAYVSGRSMDWLKFKCIVGQEFVIGGYTEPQGERTGFGALLVGYYEGNSLIYAGKVGTGYDDKPLHSLSRRLSELEQDHSLFEGEIKEKGVHWVKPDLVAQIGFSQWTAYGKLRQPRFQGLRRDKRPKEVVKEEDGHGR